jgi:transposase
MSPEYANRIAEETDLLFFRQLAIAQRLELDRLEAENEALRQQLEQLQAQVGQMDPVSQAEELRQARELLAQLKKKLFGRSSERRVPPDQPPSKKEKKVREKFGHRPQKELKQLTENHEQPPAERTCPHCQGELVPLGNEAEESTQIDVIAREFVQILHRRLKYRCRCNAYVTTAPGPLKLKPGGLYSPGFAVEVALGKYALHLPLERQVYAMKQDGLSIDSQTLWDQLDTLADVVKPTYEAILAAILKQPLILADETRWPLLANGKVKENKTCYAWCLVGEDLVGYRILDSRSQEAGDQMLAGYTGVVMADGYEVYQALARPQPGQPPPFTLAHCWSHVRRKFVDVQANHPQACAEILALIRDLFLLEREFQDLPPDERRRSRQERSKPLVDAIFIWADAQQCLPRSGLAGAIAYMKELQAGLSRFLENPLIPLSNNECERAQRGLVLGRKNHYGSRSRRGTEVAAIFYTIMESAKLAEVNVRDYLRTLTEQALRNPGAVLLPADFKQPAAIH